MKLIRYIFILGVFSLASAAHSIAVAAEQKNSQRKQDMPVLEAELPTIETFWREGENDHWALKGEAEAKAPADLIRESEAKFGITLPQLLKSL
jgi:hypothetical protein